MATVGVKGLNNYKNSDLQQHFVVAFIETYLQSTVV